MSYTHLDYQALQGPIKKVFRHADLYLFDTYGMFRDLPPAGGDGGKGDFSIVLVLMCVIDGLAAEVWPACGEQKLRFKKLIRCRLPWGPEDKGKWVHKGIAADQLYNEFRNPLVHELAKDESRARARALKDTWNQ